MSSIGLLDSLTQPLKGNFSGVRSPLRAIVPVVPLTLGTAEPTAALTMGTLAPPDILPTMEIRDVETVLPAVLGTEIPQFRYAVSSVVNTGSHRLPGPRLVRDAMISAISEVTEISTNDIGDFLKIMEKFPDPLLLRPEISTLLTEKKLIQLYTNIESDRLESFRRILKTLGRILPPTTDVPTSTVVPTDVLAGSQLGLLESLTGARKSNSDASFLGKTDVASVTDTALQSVLALPEKVVNMTNVDVLDSVRDKLFNGVFAEGPLAGLRESATVYVDQLFPVIDKLANLDSLLEETSFELSKSFDLKEYPIKSLSRLIFPKFDDVLDANGDVVLSVPDITNDLISFSRSIAPIAKDIALIVPDVPLELLVEMLAIVVNGDEDPTDLKLSIIDWMGDHPFKLLEPIAKIPSSAFDALKFDELPILQTAWKESQDFLNLYQDYSDLLDLTPDIFPLDYFGGLSKDIILRTSALVHSCDGESCTA